MQHLRLILSGAALALVATADVAVAGVPSGVGRVTEVRQTVPLRDLANSAANIRALQALQSHPVAMPLHRFPDGSLSRTARALSVATDVNTKVVGLQPYLTSPPKSVTGFTGITDGVNAQANSGGELEPPDQGLAVNNGQVVEIVNNTFAVYDATGKALNTPLANATLFNTTDNLSDPHAVYDPTTKRWFIEELEYANSASGFFGFAIAVSQTSDPLGKYNVVKVDANTSGVTSACGGTCLPDYPQVGFDANGFYITADLFSNASGSFINAGIYAIPKAALESGAKFNYATFQSPDFVVQPSQVAPGAPFSGAANGTEFLLTARNIYDGSTNLRVFALSNTNNLAKRPSSLTLNYVDVAAESYTGTVPSTEPKDVGPYGKSVGATTSPQLDGGYNAFGGGVKYASGKLYAALTTGSTDSNGLARDVLAYFVVTPTATAGAVTAKITAQGYITPATGYSLSYPGLAIDKKGNGIIGATITNPSAKVVGGYPSTGFIELQKNKPSGTFTVSGAGAASDDGFTGYSGKGPAGVGRWGDYASAVVDSTTGYYYTGNEYIPDAKKFPRGKYANWGTFITQVH